MMQPRCGLPDNLGDDGVALASTCTWRQTDLFYARDIGANDVAGNDAIDIKTPGPIVYNDALAAKLRYCDCWLAARCWWPVGGQLVRRRRGPRTWFPAAISLR